MTGAENKPFIQGYKEIHGEESPAQTVDTRFSYLDTFTSDPQDAAYFPAEDLRRLLEEEKIAGIKVGDQWMTSRANILFYKKSL